MPRNVGRRRQVLTTPSNPSGSSLPAPRTRWRPPAQRRLAAAIRDTEPYANEPQRLSMVVHTPPWPSSGRSVPGGGRPSGGRRVRSTTIYPRCWSGPEGGPGNGHSVGYGVIGSTTDSGSVSLGSSPGTPANAICVLAAPSSSGLGRRPLKAVARVQIPSGLHQWYPQDRPPGLGSPARGPILRCPVVSSAVRPSPGVCAGYVPKLRW
jgi:hypothetical protein